VTRNGKARTERPGEESLTRSMLFSGMLSLAVPMWAERLSTLSQDERIDIAHSLVDGIVGDDMAALVCSVGDRKGTIGKSFNALAKGLACLSFQLTGVVFEGTRYHWRDGRMLMTPAAP
jgi:hypothetical protein